MHFFWIKKILNYRKKWDPLNELTRVKVFIYCSGISNRASLYTSVIKGLTTYHYKSDSYITFDTCEESSKQRFTKKRRNRFHKKRRIRKFYKIRTFKTNKRTSIYTHTYVHTHEYIHVRMCVSSNSSTSVF